MIIIKKNPNLCPICQSDNIISSVERGDKICGNCGEIIMEKLIATDELNYKIKTKENSGFSSQENLNNFREFTNNNIPCELITYIQKQKITNVELKRAVKQDKHIAWDKRRLLIANTELNRVCSNLNISSYIKKETLRLYRQTIPFKINRGRSVKAMVMACLYVIIKREKSPILLSDLIKESDNDANGIKNSLKELCKRIKVSNNDNTSVVLLPRYIGNLKLNPEIENICINILSNYISKVGAGGLDPKGLCAGCIYLVCKAKRIKRTQAQIAKVCEVSEVTLRSRYCELKNKIKK